MTCERRSSVVSARTLVLLTPVLLLGLAGCGASGMGMQSRPRPLEQVQLEQRALDLLVRAAHSDIDVIRANAIEALAKVAPDDSTEHFLAALDDPAPLARYAGLVALGDVRARRALPQIERHLRDPDPRVQNAAAFAAYRCGRENAASRLVSAMNEGQDEQLRADAAFLIGKLEESKAIKWLRYVAETERSSGLVKLNAEAAMAVLGDRGSIEQMIAYVLKADVVTIMVALQTLVEVEAPAARDALRYRLMNESDYVQMRLLAGRALGRLGSSAGYDLAEELIRFEADDETETMRVRSLAALTLGAIGEPRALPLLEQLVESEGDQRVQVAGCYAICEITGTGLGR